MWNKFKRLDFSLKLAIIVVLCCCLVPAVLFPVCAAIWAVICVIAWAILRVEGAIDRDEFR